MEIKSLELLHWLQLGLALWLYIGPGFGLLSLFSPASKFDKTQRLVISAGLSIAFWPVFFLWCSLLNIFIGSAALWISGLAGWAAGLYSLRPWKGSAPRLKISLAGTLPRIVLWLVAVLIIGLGLWNLRHEVAGLGSDSYHHTLIAQLIIEQGGIPQNYLPYNPIITYQYHFGYHVSVAVLGQLSGIPLILLVPILFPFLCTIAGLSAAILLEKIGGSSWASIFPLTAVGISMVFPTFLVNWGRYPQLAGSVLLTIFLTWIWHWKEAGYPLRISLLLPLIASGLSLTHYRVTVMAFFAVVVLFLIEWLSARFTIKYLVNFSKRWLPVLLIALALSAPWLIHSIQAGSVGYPIQIAPSNQTFSSYERLGIDVLQYPTNFLVFGMAFLGGLFAIIRRKLAILWILGWASLILLLSQLLIFKTMMDPISTIITMYLPLSILIGSAILLVLELRSIWLRRGLAALTFALLLVAGLIPQATIVSPYARVVYREDMQAAEWIKANTPPDAYFMINTFAWVWRPDFIVGWDAGKWLPITAQRRTPLPPMVYNIERASIPNLSEQLLELHHLRTNLDSAETIAKLKAYGITHIYLGQMGGFIDPQVLTNSLFYTLVYHQSNTYVFAIK